jgi:hypothetical protein
MAETIAYFYRNFNHAQCAIIFLSEKGSVRQNKNLAQIKLVLPYIKRGHMGLDERQKKVCAEIAQRYQKAGKKDCGKLLDEYTVTLGYNRDYLAHILSNWGKTRYARADGKPVKTIAAPAPQCGEKALKTAPPPVSPKRGAESQVPGSALHGASGGHLGLVRLFMREAPGPYAPPYAGLPDRRIFPCP